MKKYSGPLIPLARPDHGKTRGQASDAVAAQRLVGAVVEPCRPGDLDGPGRGAMQAIDRAVIVEERSAGICVVANLMQLPNGATFMYPIGTQRDNRKSR